MKYCKTCKIPAKDSESVCPKCRGPISVFGSASAVAEPVPAPVETPPIRSRRVRWLAVGAIGLVCFVTGLAYVAWPRPATTPSGEAGGDQQVSASRKAVASKNGPKIAVTFASFDDVGKLLDGLGPRYRHQVIDDEVLRDADALGPFESIFLTCADQPEGKLDADGSAALRNYVAGGGILYASDLQFERVAAAFPDLVDRASVAQGAKQDLDAEVVSPELKAVVGPRITLHFGLEGWRPAAFKGPGVVPLLKATLRTTVGIAIEVPLAVSFRFGKGSVLFTSYHQEDASRGVELDFLRFLILKTVTARAEAEAVAAMADGGFVPSRVRSFLAKPGGGRSEETIPHPRAGALKFTMAAPEGGTTIRLEVISPTGVRTVKEGGSSLAIDVADAGAGDWRYLAHAESGPLPNAAAMVIVAEPGRADVAANLGAIPAQVATGGNVFFEEIPIGNAPKGPRRAPRIAVTPPVYDDMGKLLDSLGPGFRYTTLTKDAIRTPGALQDYDVIFLTCGGWPAEWGTTTGGIIREGLNIGELRPEISRRISANIREFVEGGGTLYASDQRCIPLYEAFPQRLPFRFLNVEILPQLIQVERSWIDTKAPLSKIGTLADVLKAANLSPKLVARHDHLVLAIESTTLVSGNPLAIKENPEKEIRDALDYVDLPAEAADVATIARVLRDWETDFRKAYLGRKPRDVARDRDKILQSETELANLRARIRPDPSGRGKQLVQAEVVDQGLREVLGTPILELRFKDDNWIPARFGGEGISVLLRGPYITESGVQTESPLLVKFSEGQGTVIFTSFHNEALNSAAETLLLRHLVFSAVTAKAEAMVDKTMLSGGFSPAKRSQISHSSGKDTVTRIYTSDRPGPIRFALTFTGAGARLRLTIVSPDGQRYAKEVESTIVIQATGAPAGNWTYTVDSIEVPYQNFPFSVGVGRGNRPLKAR